MQEINIKQLKQFPFHDAVFISFQISRNANNNVEVILNLQIVDFSYQPDYVIPINNGFTKLYIKDCYFVGADIKGLWGGDDTFDIVKIMDDSDLLRQQELLSSSNLWHLHFVFHSGSKVDIIMKKRSFFIE